MRTPLLFLASVLISSQVASARAADQPLVLPLYTEAVPGEAAPIATEKITGAQGKRQISLVSQPSITVYLPPKEKNTGTAVVIAPGGGYNILAIDHEGYDVATWLNSIGVAGIVLKYRVPGILDGKLPANHWPARLQEWLQVQKLLESRPQQEQANNVESNPDERGLNW